MNSERIFPMSRHQAQEDADSGAWAVPILRAISNQNAAWRLCERPCRRARRCQADPEACLGALAKIIGEDVIVKQIHRYMEAGGAAQAAPRRRVGKGA
jgi:hypothetical protein